MTSTHIKTCTHTDEQSFVQFQLLMISWMNTLCSAVWCLLPLTRLSADPACQCATIVGTKQPMFIFVIGVMRELSYMHTLTAEWIFQGQLLNYKVHPLKMETTIIWSMFMYFTVLLYYTSASIQCTGECDSYIYNDMCSFISLSWNVHTYFYYLYRIIMWQKHHAVHSFFHSHFIFSLLYSWMMLARLWMSPPFGMPASPLSRPW